MNRHTKAAFAGLFLIAGAGAASAQAVIVEQQPDIVLVPEQQTIIREYITTQPPMEYDPAIDFDITVGSIVPEPIELRRIDEPTLDTPYDYVVIENRTVVVEPETRRIVQIIE